MARKDSIADKAFFDELENISRELADRKITLENGVTPAQIDKLVADGRKRLVTIAKHQSSIADEVDAKRKVKDALMGLRKKARAGVKGKFGDDSNEYAAVVPRPVNLATLGAELQVRGARGRASEREGGKDIC